MSDRSRKPSRAGGSRTPFRATSPRRFTSRRQRETAYQRLFYIGLIAAAALVIIILGVGAFWEYQVKPNQVLATVNGHQIKRSDYWRYQIITLDNQARMYEDYALQVTGQQQTQFLMYAAQFDEMRKDVWGSSDVSEATIREMVEDRLYVQGAEEMGIDLSRPTLEAYALNAFTRGGELVVTPVPSPTMIPTRAAWATETQVALDRQEALAMGTPEDQISLATPGATPIGTSAATPDPQAVRSSAEIEFEAFQDDILSDARMSLDQYYDMVVKPEYAREQVNSTLENDVPQVADQVKVQHILVATEDLANETYARVTGGADFSEVAKTTSTDSISAPTGGQLGWITDQQLPDAFSQAAFSTEPGQVAEPVHTEYGWHIIRVEDRQDDRPMTETQYSLAKTEAVESWLDEQKEQADISSSHYDKATPEPTVGQFYPPADAPTPVVATPVPATDISATPISGPQLPADASPVASPGATPAASPIALPATPAA